MELKGKVALVTGGGRSIGRGISLALVDAGAKVMFNYVSDAEAAQHTHDLIKEKGGEAAFIEADVGEIEPCRELVRKANETFGQVDIFVSNAGIGQPQSIVDTPDDVWDRVMNVNVRATFALARELLPGMVERKHGRIVTISSNAGVFGTAMGSKVTYGTSKAALLGLTKGIALEGAPYVTANAICPGGTAKEIASERGYDGNPPGEWPPPTAQDDPYLQTQSEDRREKKFLGRPVPLNRRGVPEDIAAGVLYLVADSGCFVTGQTIYISGGTVMP